MGKSDEKEKVVLGSEDVGKVSELFDSPKPKVKKAAAAEPADHQQSQSGGASPYAHPGVEGAVPGEQVMSSGEIKDPPPEAHPAPEPPKAPNPPAETLPPQPPPVIEKAKPAVAENRPHGPQCPKCGSTSIGMAGGMRRCNQCSNAF